MNKVTGIGGIFFKSKDPQKLRAGGANVDPKTDESEFGKFGWVMDPEGNRVELWEPPTSQK